MRAIPEELFRQIPENSRITFTNDAIIVDDPLVCSLVEDIINKSPKTQAIKVESQNFSCYHNQYRRL